MRRFDPLPPVSPHFVSFAWRYHRCVRASSPSVPDAGPRIILELVSRCLQPAETTGTAGSPKFPGNPCDHSLMLLRPRRDQAGSVGPGVSCLTRPPHLTTTKAHRDRSEE